MSSIISSCRRRKLLLCVMALPMFFLPHTAFAKTHKKHTPHHHMVVDGSASYADIVIEADSGRILHSSSADQLRHPASLTKMMTLYITFQALEAGRLKLGQYLPISSNAAEQSPSKLGLRPGQRIKVEDAILGVVTESANDAAVVLAEWMGGGSEKAFGQMMTRQAHALGMSHTHYDNASGLPDDEQVTTARDMAVLGHALIYHFPQFYPYFSHDSFTYAGIYHHNHNHLMDRYDGMDGIKTGYIRASGFNLVASAKRDGVRLIGVVFGGKSTTARDNQMAILLDQSFVRAQREKGVRVATSAANDTEGDSDDDSSTEHNDYVALPSKMALLFPSQDEAPARSSAVIQDNPLVSGSWGIQIGAYSDPAVGQAALSGVIRSMPQVLGSADPEVQKITVEGGVPMYRARLMSLDQKTAQSVCNWLVRHGQNCMAVGP